MIQRGRPYVTNAVACFVLAVALSMPVLAAGPPSLTLPPGSQDAALGEQLRLYGMPVTIRIFDAPLGVPELAKWFSDQQTGLTELSVMPGKIVMSGVIDDTLWTVLMESQGAKRTAGSIAVSSLPSSHSTSAASPSLAGMPNDARLRFDFSSLGSGERVTQQIWSHPWPPERLRPLLHSGLRNKGWQTVPAALHTELWTRGSSRLQLTMVSMDDGTGVWSLQQDK